MEKSSNTPMCEPGGLVPDEQTAALIAATKQHCPHKTGLKHVTLDGHGFDVPACKHECEEGDHQQRHLTRLGIQIAVKEAMRDESFANATTQIDRLKEIQKSLETPQ